MVVPIKKEVFWTDDEVGLLYLLDEALHSTRDIDRLFFIILTAATAGSAFSFPRAALLLLDESRGRLQGVMGIGPGSPEEANRVWTELGGANPNLHNLLANYDNFDRNGNFNRAVTALDLNLSDCPVCGQVVRAAEIFMLTRPLETGALHPELAALFSGSQVVITPIPDQTGPLGLLAADNAFSGRPVSERQVQLLAFFSERAGMILEMVRVNQELNQKLKELNQAYHELYEAKHNLTRSAHLASIGRSISYVSHEIREPLSVIGGLARIISRASSDPESREQALQAYQKCLELSRFVDKSLAYARLGRFELTACRVNDLITEVSDDLFKKLAEETGRRTAPVIISLKPGLPEIMADPEQLRHVFLNLIENGLFSIRDLPEGRVRVATDFNRDSVTVTVEDNGHGIAAGDLEKIFEPFFTTRLTGSGLGLAFAREAVENAGGSIKVASPGPEEGARFVVTLPRKREGGGR